MIKRFLHTTLTLTITLVVCLAAGEVVVRLLFKDRLEILRDERSLTYRFDPSLGWFPREGSQKSFTGFRTVSVNHNRFGFRDHEYQQKDKPRIAFVGDSFVWGFDVEEDERFTNKLQTLIPQWEVLNLGVSGFGTDQEFLLLQQWYSTLQPDIVFLVYTDGSDDYDNLKRTNFGGYFKPFYLVEEDEISLQGVPVPKGANYRFQEYPILFRSYFARGLARALDKVRTWGDPIHTVNPTVYIIEAMNEFLKLRNTQFAIGFHGCSTEPFGDKERRFCDQLEIPCVDLQTELVYPAMGNHWTPQGHELVARRIHKFLRQ